MGEILFVLCLLGLVLTITLGVRNNSVYRHRCALLDKIHQAAQHDIKLGRDWLWRYDILHSVSYERQLFQFWKRLGSFWPSLEFIEPSRNSADSHVS